MEEIAKENEIKIEGFKLDKIRSTERHLDDNDDIDAAMKELEEILGFHWDKYYPQIKKQVERNK